MPRRNQREAARPGRRIAACAGVLLVVWIALLAALPGAADEKEQTSPAGTAEAQLPVPARLPKPILSPSALPVSSQPIPVSVGVSLGRSLVRPEVLLLEQVDVGSVLAELRDDGEKPDAKRGDGFYSGRFELTSPRETTLELRLRDRERKATSPPLRFVVTSLPLGFRDPVSPVLIETRNGSDRVFANELALGTDIGVEPARVREIVAAAAATLDLAPEDLEITGSVPPLHAYSVHFEGEATLDALERVISAFTRERDVRYATPSFLGRDNAWYHDVIGVSQMRSDASGTAFAGVVHGDPSIGVAVMENGTDCSHPDFSCEPNPFSGSCAARYVAPGAAAGHGTKVMTLVAGASGPLSSFDGVEEGVAWDTTLYSFRAEAIVQLAEAISCATTLPASTGAAAAQIVNVSREYSFDSPILRDAVCEAACANMLLVAAAGNGACPASPGGPPNDTIDRFPALYGIDPTDCSCAPGVAPIRDHVIAVGGVDESGNHGDRCATLSTRSKSGEIFAPGWGVPTDDGDAFSYGTSWAAPLVSGCAAVLGAVTELASGPGAWDASAAESRLRGAASGSPPILDCAEAVFAPYDVAFVLDRSGSMGSTANVNIPSDPSATRWDALNLAADGFGQLISATAPPGSRFGLTLFAGGVLPDPITDLQSIGTSLPTDLAAALSITPGGSTGIGAGLQQALGELTEPSRPRVIVLFSDGEQNQNPRVASNGCQFANPASDIHSNCPGVAPAGTTKIVTVGIGQPSGDYLTTLMNLAHSNRGASLISSDGAIFNGDVSMSTLGDAFAQAIAPALASSSPQVVASYKGKLSRSETFAPFAVNRHVSRLLIRLSLQRRVETPDLLRLFQRIRISKDGVDVTQHFTPIVSGNASSSFLLRSNFAAAQNAPTIEGQYTLVFTAPDPVRRDLAFHAVAYADDHELDIEWNVEPATPRVDQPFRPTLQLRWRGHAIPDAQVKAWILRPGDDLGDALAQHPAVVDLSTAPDAGSPGTQKYLQLLESDANFREKLAPIENAVSLEHQGDGVYSAEFDPGDVSGVYQVLYRVVAHGTAFGTIQRQAVESVYTRFGEIDLGTSELARVVAGKTTTLTLRPRTANGRLVGPAQGSAFAIQGPGNELKSVTDHQDGRYTIILVGDPTGPISIAILGDVVFDGRLDQVESDGEPEPARLPLWLLALLLILVLLVLWIRRTA